jgi:hypothetical protein
VPRSASATVIQNRCGSRSPSCTGTHAARSARPGSAIYDRSKNVFPLAGLLPMRRTIPGPRARVMRITIEGYSPEGFHGVRRTRGAVVMAGDAVGDDCVSHLTGDHKYLART